LSARARLAEADDILEPAVQLVEAGGAELHDQGELVAAHRAAAMMSAFILSIAFIRSFARPCHAISSSRSRASSSDSGQ
jgi:hypothetical protein